MKRKIYQELINWKNTNIQKPLMIIGARQIGKTYIINVFCNKEFENYNSDEGRDYEKKIIKNLDGLQNYIHCSYIIDKENLLDMKMSPIDAGENVFKELLRNRVSIN